MARFSSFDEFWPHYLAQHTNPTSRALHYTGSTLALGTVLAAAVLAQPWFLLATPIVGYSCAWTGHFVFEKNRPATFGHPFWSLRGDFHMLALALRGRMTSELARVVTR